jgi:pimeloyl-ACP methyl ester carboxylesterase
MDLRPTAASLVALSLACAGTVTRPAAVEDDVTFTRYSPLSRSEELLRRTLPPVALRHGQRALAAKGEALRDQPVDLARERFTVYVPGRPPPDRGFGLLVFVSPSSRATDPRRWRSTLDRHRLIFVSASNSGNDANVYERRLPLAVLAYENVRALHPVDPDRVYVGGLSGGARVAEVAAVAYPDVFRGALLNAGSDPLGDHGVPLPPAELFGRLQETRFVYVTGGEDEAVLEKDEVSRASLKKWCIFDVAVQIPQRLGHEPLDAASMGRALDALEQRPAPDAGRLARCNADLQRELRSSLAGAEAAIARGDRNEARARIQAIDARYGGLAAPELLELDAKLAAGE